MKQQNKLKLLLPALAVGMLSACVNSGSSSDSGSDSGNSGGGNILSDAIPGVYISQTSTMPLTGAGGQSFYLSVSNDTDKSVSLASVSATSAGKTTSSGTKTDYYNAAGCHALGPKQSCLIEVTPQKTASNFVLNTSFKDANGKAYDSHQLVQFGDVASVSGFKVTNNNLQVVKKSSQSFQVAIPFVLDNDYTSLTVKSNIPTLQQNLLCNSNSYSKNSSCTAILTLPGGDYLDKIVISGTEKSMLKQSIHKHALNSNSANAALASVMLGASSGSVANIIHNGYNLQLTTGSTKSFDLLNTGLADTKITAITPSSTSSVTIKQESSTCAIGTTLTSNGSYCTLALDTTVTKNNANANVKISFEDGSYKIVNLVEIAANPAPGLSITPNGNLLGTSIAGGSQNLTITIQNNGNTPMNDIAFGHLPNGFTLRAYDPSNGVTCKTDGTQSLAKNDSCTVVVNYKPTTETSLKYVDFYVTAQYADTKTGNPVSYTDNTTFEYSANNNQATLSLSVNSVNQQFGSSNPVTFATINANNTDYIESTFTLTNTGSDTAAEVKFDTTSLIAQPSVSIVSNDCSNVNLTAGSSCSVTVKYGPVQAANATSIPDVVVPVSYRKNTLSDTDVSSNNLYLNFSSVVSAIITPVNTPVLPDPATTPGLTQPTPGVNTYDLIMTPTNPVTIKYTYKNTGSETARNFNVDITTAGGNLGMLVDSSSNDHCPTGIEKRDLAVGETCELTLQYIDSAYLAAFGGVNLVVYRPGYSYTDTLTKVNVVPADTTTPTTLNSINWATVQSSDATGVAGAVRLTFDLSNYNSTIVPATIADGAVTVTLPKLATQGFTATSNTCVIASPDTSCSIDLTYNTAIPATTHYISWSAAPANGSATPLTGTATVTTP